MNTVLFRFFFYFSA
ncbi:pheST operon leader peptide PheM [Shigella flexneri]